MSFVFPQIEITDIIAGTGISSKKPIRVATILDGIIKSSFSDGSVVDDVTLNTGDRILIKNQSSPIENGVYDVNATGAPFRATDFNEGENVGGSIVYIIEGTVNKGTGWLCTNALNNDLVGIDPLEFKLISGDLRGASSSTDNAIVRWDGSTGEKIKNSSILIDESNNMTGLQYLEFNDISAPINPGNAKARLYKKTDDDGLWWRPDAAGPELDLTAGGSAGVTSLSGTSNQITSSASTGAVTLSTPSTFVAPGSIESTTSLTAGTLFYEGTCAKVRAAGTDQETATALTMSYNVVTMVEENTGVVLPKPAAGLKVTVVNNGANTLRVYPISGGTIDTNAANAAVVIPANGSSIYQAVSTKLWQTVNREGKFYVFVQRKGQIIANYTTIDWNVITSDASSLMSSGVFTTPRTGLYSINLNLFTLLMEAGNAYNLFLFKNGAQFLGSGTEEGYGCLSATVNLNTGDTITVQINAGTNTFITAGVAFNFMTIVSLD